MSSDEIKAPDDELELDQLQDAEWDVLDLEPSWGSL